MEELPCRKMDHEQSVRSQGCRMERDLRVNSCTLFFEKDPWFIIVRIIGIEI